MSDLRQAAQQALEALEYDGLLKKRQAITALRDALAQQPEPVQEPGQDLIPPDSLFVCGQMGAHVTRVRLAEPAQEPVAWGWVGDPSTQDYAATQPDPVEPVAWNWMLDGRPYGQAYYGNPPDADIVERAAISGRTVRLLYTAPPQRPRLTDDEILEAVGWERAEMYMKLTPNFPVDEAKKETLKNARAVERRVRGETE